MLFSNTLILASIAPGVSQPRGFDHKHGGMVGRSGRVHSVREAEGIDSHTQVAVLDKCISEKRLQLAEQCCGMTAHRTDHWQSEVQTAVSDLRSAVASHVHMLCLPDVTHS